jgi:hypothetical protein
MHQTYKDEYHCDPITGKQILSLHLPQGYNEPFEKPSASAFPQPSPMYSSTPYGAFTQPPSTYGSMPQAPNRSQNPRKRYPVLLNSGMVTRTITPGFTQDGDRIVAVSNTDDDNPSECDHTYTVHIKNTNQVVIMSKTECGGAGVWSKDIPCVKKDAARIFKKLGYPRSWVREPHSFLWIACGKAAVHAISKPLMICQFY